MPIIMFPGQGSQKQGMSPDLVSAYPDLFNQASALLSEDITDIVHSDRIHATQYTQPLLFVYHHAAFLAWQEANDVQIDAALGHSLGEYNALCAASAISFDVALKCVIERARLMSGMAEGTMCAVLGLTADQVRQGLEVFKSSGVLDLANHNEETQVVVAGQRKVMDEFAIWAKDHGAKRVVPLQVSGAFHSSLMQQAAQSFDAYTQTILKVHSDWLMPVIANLTARPYEVADVQSTLVAQMHNPVLWHDSIQYLVNKGMDDFIEINVGIPVLEKMVRRILRSS